MNDNDDNRPSPDFLLEQANRERRGKLKIFIGAAPGVGKTFSMLRAAHSRKKAGIDVVVGIVETHQRSETDAILEGIEVIPRLNLDYRGIQFQEMDIDAVLKRRPQLVLVDELAHSNIPGARHPKRYQDVMELLDSGIDVYSTLNVQHIESLNDIVTRITGVTVRETVPDSIIQNADSIELIDLTPEELLQRLKEGKVYIPEQARLAMGRFFTPGNLTALRELALRQAAARVDDQMTSYMRQHAIAGPWPASERVLVCIGDDGQGASLVRTAKRSAERRQADWIAVYVETHRHASLSDSARREITRTLHLAESLGGETLTVTGEDVAGEILHIARERNVKVIIIGKTQRSWWSRMLRPSAAAAVLDRGGSFDIMVMNGAEGRPRKSELGLTAEQKIFEPWYKRIAWRAYARATVTVSIASVICWGASFISDISSLSLLYLISVLLVAVDCGFIVSAYASALSFVVFDFLFIEPRFSLIITRHEDLLTLLFFLVVAFAISFIGDYLQRQIKVTRLNAERTRALYDFSKAIAATATFDDVAATVVHFAANSMKARIVLLLVKGDKLAPKTSFPVDVRLDTASNAAMDWIVRHGRPAGLNSDTLPGAQFYGLPLKMGDRTLGVLAIRPDSGSFTLDQENFLISLASQSAVAIERVRLVEDIEGARLQTETERLRASLLSSISHDIRAPLLAIMGTVNSLRSSWERYDDKMRQKMLATLEDETASLSHFIDNLLDMTQLVSGGLKLRRQPLDIRNAINGALTLLRKALDERPMRIDITADVPLVDADAIILERVLVNIIDNACKFAPLDQPITISAGRDGPDVRVTITDRGSGIPEDERERVFDMFYRVKGRGVPLNGAGLGLAICRGFVEAHGGQITALPGSDGIGTQIVLRLPAIKT
jgi:two-component system sensor histidine kinase KdpD